MRNCLRQARNFTGLIIAEWVIYSMLLEKSVSVLVQAVDDGETHVSLAGLEHSMEHQCFVLAEFVSVVDSIPPKPILKLQFNLRRSE